MLLVRQFKSLFQKCLLPQAVSHSVNYFKFETRNKFKSKLKESSFQIKINQVIQKCKFLNFLNMYEKHPRSKDKR